MTLHILEDLTQGTDEWLEQRRGMVTASVVGKLLTVGPPSALVVACETCGAAANTPCVSLTRKTPTPIQSVHDKRTAATFGLPSVVDVADNDTSRALIATLTAERISRFTEDLPTTSDMWRGIESEPFARDAYANTGHDVTEVGFMVEDRWGFKIGYSPDGLVGDDGLLEIKAPRAKSHLLTVIGGEVPAVYMAQLQTGLLVSGRKWIDYVPFVGGMPLWTKRIYPDLAWHDAIVRAVANFETTSAEMVAAYTTATDGLPVTERLPDLEMSL